MMTALLWLRRWGTWILVAALMAVCGVMWLMLRAARAKAEAKALADTVIDLGREADWAYAQARGAAARERNDELEQEIAGMVREMDRTLAEKEADRADPDEMDDKELAAELDRRFGRGGSDGAGI